MLTGTIYVTTDINMVMSCIGKCNIVRIGDEDQRLDDRFTIVGKVISPPYQALSAYLDNDINTFLSLYEQHLNSKMCVQFISILFKALMNGNNLLLYLNNDEYEIYFGALMRHIANKYGVVIGTPNNSFEFNPNYIHVILSYLYDFELLTVQEYLELYPQGIPLPSFVVQKLINEINPNIPNASIETYMEYFNNLKEMIKRNNNKYLELAISRG